MSSIPLAPSRPVLVDRVLPGAVRRSAGTALATDAGLVLVGVGLTAALAQIEIPLWPVPITGQTLAVLLVGASLGAVRGGLSMVLYALIGAIGAPIFSDHASGTAVLLGPTGGYIVGFVLAAALTGWLAQRRWERGLVRGMLSFVAGSAVVFLVGLPWLKVSLGLDWPTTISSGLTPFIVGGVIKAAVAALVLRGAWAVVDRADAAKRA